MAGIYLHIPFCKQACSYCDFYFVTRQDHIQDFVDELIREIHSKKETHFADETIHTIYFGGGTPSLLTVRQLGSILKALNDVFKIELTECTLEMNPDDVTQEYLADIKSLGITRASMGVQSFNPKLLTFMHRAHNRQEALKSLELLAIGNLPSFSVDLIYGNPGQSLQMLEQDIQTLLSFSPPHISAYSLTIEPRTRLGKQFDLGRLIPKENDEVAQHYDMVYEMLKNNGIAQYEVSNYAKPGSEALHNSAYWNHQNYLGFGPAAHSYWWGESKQWAKRWTGSKTLNTYLKGGWEKMHHLEKLNQTTLAEERLMLGLRTVAGLKISELGFLYGYRISEKQKTYLKRLQSDAKVNLSDDQIQLTSKGLRVSDSIILDLLSC